MRTQPNAAQQFEYWKSLQVSSRPRAAGWRRVLKILMSLVAISMTIIFIWGFGTILFNNNVVSKALPTGNGNETQYLSGVFFQINAGLPNSVTEKDKLHFVFSENGVFKTYQYFPVTHFKDMWETAVSPVYVLFVLPVSWLVTQFSFFFGWTQKNISAKAPGNLFAVLGAVFLTTLLIKLTTLHSLFAQRRNKKKMDKIKNETDAIKEKYSKDASFANKQKERAEISALHRKNNINPLSAQLQGFIFAPLLLTIFLVVRYSLIVKVSGTEHFALNGSIYEEMTQGPILQIYTEWRYILLVVLYAFITFGDVLFDHFFVDTKKIKPTSALAKKNEKRQKIIKWVFLGFFFWLFFTIPVGTSVYWIYNGFLDKAQKISLHAHDQRSSRRLSSYKAKLL